MSSQVSSVGLGNGLPLLSDWDSERFWKENRPLPVLDMKRLQETVREDLASCSKKESTTSLFITPEEEKRFWEKGIMRFHPMTGIVGQRAIARGITESILFQQGTSYSVSCSAHGSPIISVPLEFITSFKEGKELSPLQKFTIDHMLYHIKMGDSTFTFSSKSRAIMCVAIGILLCGVAACFGNVVLLIVGVALLIIFGSYFAIRSYLNEKKEKQADAFAFNLLTPQERAALLGSLQEDTTKAKSASIWSRCISWFRSSCFPISEKRIASMSANSGAKIDETGVLVDDEKTVFSSSTTTTLAAPAPAFDSQAGQLSEAGGSRDLSKTTEEKKAATVEDETDDDVQDDSKFVDATDFKI